MTHRSPVYRALATFALLSALTACRSPILGSVAGATGSLRVMVPSYRSGAASRAPVQESLRPAFASIAAWSLSGSGPDGAVSRFDFSAAELASGSTSVDLLFGAWDLTLAGYDADGAEVLKAAESVTIERGADNACAFTMSWADKALIARLSFDTAIRDDTGRLAATPSDATGWSPSASTAGAPSLDGQSYLAFSGSRYVDLSALDLGERFSISLWIYVSGIGDMVLATSRKTSGGDGFTLYRGASGTIRVETRGGSNLETGTVTSMTGTWYHVAFTMDALSGRTSIFVDGVLQASAEVLAIDTSLPVRLGGSFYEPYGFNGRMDDVRVYTDALAADDVAALFADGYFSGGRGTAASPYLVATPMDLYNARYFPAARFLQAADIDLGASAMTSPFPPICDNGAAFTGVYDGGSRTISNLSLGAGTNYDGLFSAIGTGGSVRDLTLNGVAGTVTKITGALVGVATGATITNVLVQNASIVSSYDYFGGLAGQIMGSTVSQARVAGATLTTGARYAGGLAGSVDGASVISYCSASGSVQASNADSSFLGGLIGSINRGRIEQSQAAVLIGTAGGVTWNNSANQGGFVGYASTISGAIEMLDCSATGNVSGGNGGNANVGGFAGLLAGSGSASLNLERCIAAGSVSVAQGDHVGGFAGRIGSYVSVSRAAATGDVIATGSDYVGGFAGDMTGSADTIVTMSRASGAVSGSRRVGGFLGYGGGASDHPLDMTQCRSSGTVSATYEYLGGFVGYVANYATIEDSYTVSDVTKDVTSAGGFVGYIMTITDITVSRCYAAGTLARTDNKGGFVGYAGSAFTASTSAWDSEVSGQEYDGDNSSGANPYGTTAMQPSGASGAYAGWNNGLWTFAAGSYPRLAWEP